MKEYEVQYVRADGMFAVFVPELPGAHSQGRTLAEARRNITEAIELVVASNRLRLESSLRGKKIVFEVVRVAA